MAYKLGVGRGRHKEQWNMSAVNVEEDDDQIYITIPYDEDAKEALKEKFKARWDPEAKHWYVDKTRSDIRIEDVEAELKLHFPRAFR